MMHMNLAEMKWDINVVLKKAGRQWIKLLVGQSGETNETMTNTSKGFLEKHGIPRVGNINFAEKFYLYISSF